MRPGANLALLAAAAGMLDGLGYMRLGPVLISAMTGNLALLGLAIGQFHLSDATHSVAAILCFVAGVALGAAIMDRAPRDRWSRRAAFAFVVEALFLAASALLWMTTTKSRPALDVYALIVLASFGMGMQSAIVRHLDGPGIATTFLTGTLTGMIISLVHGGEATQRTRMPLQHMLGQIYVLVAYAAGAVFAGVALSHAFDAIAVLPLVAVLITIAINRVEG